MKFLKHYCSFFLNHSSYRWFHSSFLQLHLLLLHSIPNIISFLLEVILILQTETRLWFVSLIVIHLSSFFFSYTLPFVKLIIVWLLTVLTREDLAFNSPTTTERRGSYLWFVKNAYILILQILKVDRKWSVCNITFF
jgi:hypothetical protein